MKCPCCEEGVLVPLTPEQEEVVLACWDCTHNIDGDPHLCGTAKAILERRGDGEAREA
jgi:hypothetical protein